VGIRGIDAIRFSGLPRNVVGVDPQGVQSGSTVLVPSNTLRFNLVAGVGVSYQQSGDVILAPMRTGVGLRAGANVGYLHCTDPFSRLPL
jgi:hypothetical protein